MNGNGREQGGMGQPPQMNGNDNNRPAMPPQGGQKSDQAHIDDNQNSKNKGDSKNKKNKQKNNKNIENKSGKE